MNPSRTSRIRRVCLRAMIATAVPIGISVAMFAPARKSTNRAAAPKRPRSAGHKRLAASDLTTGGLLSCPQFVLGDNLVNNGGFEDAGANGKAAGWTDNGFSPDAAVAHNGGASLRLTDAYLIPYAQSAWQALALKKGTYSLRGWVKLQDMAAQRPSGVRICLLAQAGNSCTEIMKGTGDWRQLGIEKIVLPQDTTARVSLQAYGEPDGTAWFDDVELRREQQPLDVFLMYPNYRGILFDDAPQTVRFSVSVIPPADGSPSDYTVKATVVEENSGSVLLQSSVPGADQQIVPIDFSGLDTGSYVTVFCLYAADGSAVFEYPGYRVVKVTGSVRSSMAFSVDDLNRVIMHGQPAFVLGLYDSGLGYVTAEQPWEDMLSEQRRLFELPINMYLNYWYGGVGNDTFIPLLNVLQQHGIQALTNTNCFGASTVEQMASYWFANAPDGDVQQRAAHPAFAGFYVADECHSDLVPDVFAQYQRMRTLNPDGLALGTLLADAGTHLWRDTVDVLATDPYPLYGPEPASGYPLSRVADWTRTARQAVQDSRPVFTVLQFFQGTSNSRWPTQAELRNMSYMAIAEGANGLFYWSAGTRALAWVCSGWCDQKAEYFARLKAVLTEIKGLEPTLLAADRPDLLAACDTPGVHTRVKFADGQAWLIASNVSGSAVTATFTWTQPLNTVTVFGENRSLAASDNSFSDAFGPYEAHVYVVGGQP